MNKKCGIYGWRCTDSGKWYVGQSVNIERRKSHHLHELRGGIHKNKHFQSSFTKYGEKAFEFHVLEEIPEDMLDVRERTWIVYFKSTEDKFGYNLERGGHLNKQMSEKTKTKMSITRLGYKLSAITKDRISKSNKGKHSEPHSIEHTNKIAESNRGKTRSPETRAKISRGNSGKIRSLEQRKAMSIAHIGIKQPRELVEKRALSVMGQRRTQQQRINMVEAWVLRKINIGGTGYKRGMVKV
jgi:group I intron endonuclease